MGTFSHYFLPIYLLLFGLVFFWHSLIVWRKTGVNPYVLHKAKGAQALVAKLFRPLGGILIIVLGGHLFSPDLSLFFCPMTFLLNSTVELSGLAVLIAALVWVFLAQAQMGISWRIGIDDENPADLVSRGLFKYSRNPVFLGVRFFFLGLFLVAPSLAMLSVMLFAELLIQLQVRFEEEYLLALHGEPYKKYCGQVNRWL